MPLPVHPRSGHFAQTLPSAFRPQHNIINNASHKQQRNRHSASSHKSVAHHSPPCSSAAAVHSAFAGRNVILASLSVSLALAMLLILAFQLELFGTGPERLFAEIRLRALDGSGEEFSIFGRKLAIDAAGDYFLGIPYASPTTGRFQQAGLIPLPRNFYAIHYGNGCPNGFLRTKPAPGINWNPPPLETVPVHEQCHTLNIYRCNADSAQSRSQLVPVLVYINEGHWLKRSNANLEPTQSIRQLACNKQADSGGLLIVSINYRMGPFGHFHAPGWPPEHSNFALWDIRTALQWIQTNIAYFGGHKAHVTVMARGEGAKLVSLLGMLPQGQGLFKRQILIAGSAFAPTLLQPAHTTNDDGITADGDAAFDASMHFAIAAGCVNAREWKMLTEAAKNGNIRNGSALAEINDKMEKCLLETPVVASQARVLVQSFQHWPIITNANASFAVGQRNEDVATVNDFLVPSNPFRNIPPIPTIVGFCLQKKMEEKNTTTMEEKTARKMDNNNNNNNGFKRWMAEALKEELNERMSRMVDLPRLDAGNGDAAGEVIRHYLQAIGQQRQNNGIDQRNGPDELFEQIIMDFTLAGPALLEAFVRAQLANARIYGFVFESPPQLNLSMLDVAEKQPSAANAWTSAQPACIDDLLFNPLPKDLELVLGEQQRKFADRLASFVAYGEPNPDEPDGRGGIGEWPTAFPRQSERLAGAIDVAAWPRWFWLSNNSSTVRTGMAQFLFGDPGDDGGHFWLCRMARIIAGNNAINHQQSLCADENNNQQR